MAARYWVAGGNGIWSSTTNWSATSGGSAGASVPGPTDVVAFPSGNGGTATLDSNVTVSYIEFDNGTLNLNGFTLTTGDFVLYGPGYSKNITFNGGTLRVGGDFTNYHYGLTTTAGTGSGTISMSSAANKTFAGGGATFNCTLSNDGAGILTISGSNSFASLANGVSNIIFFFTSGTTQTITDWKIKGADSSNLVWIAPSSPGTNATISKSSGLVISDYLKLASITATGGATWYAGANSVQWDTGNVGWNFSAAPVISGTLAVSDPPDIAKFSVGPRLAIASAPIASRSIAGGAVAVYPTAVIAATDAPDTPSMAASVSGTVWNAALAAVEPTDTAAITATAIAQYSLVASAGACSSSGVANQLIFGRALRLSATSFSATGVAARVVATRRLPLAASIFAATGSVAATLVGRATRASSAAFSQSGVAARTIATRLVRAYGGSFNITWAGASSVSNPVMRADGGAFVYTGNDTSRIISRGVRAASAAFTSAGVAVRAVSARLVRGSAGSSSVAGVTVIVVAARRALATGAAFSTTGVGSPLLAGRRITPQPSEVTQAGYAQRLTLGRAVITSFGSFAAAGRPITATATRFFRPQAGSAQVTGVSAAVKFERRIAPIPGAFITAGRDLIDHKFAVKVGSGSFACSGGEAGFRRTYVFHPSPANFAQLGQPSPLLRGYAFGAGSGFVLCAGLSASYRRTMVLRPGLTGYGVLGRSANLVAVQVFPVGLETIYVPQELSTFTLQQPQNYSITLGIYLSVETENRLLYIPSKSFTAEDIQNSSLKVRSTSRAAG